MESKRSISALLKEKGVKIATIIENCEQIDRNSDGLIHIYDLVGVVNRLIKPASLTSKQIDFLASFLTGNKNLKLIRYTDLDEVLNTSDRRSRQENWFSTELSQSSRGSLGEFLQKSACPAEIRNLQLFNSLLESYERQTGLKVKINENTGEMIVPLGPDLQVELNYCIKM